MIPRARRVSVNLGGRLVVTAQAALGSAMAAANEVTASAINTQGAAASDSRCAPRQDRLIPAPRRQHMGSDQPRKRALATQRRESEAPTRRMGTPCAIWNTRRRCAGARLKRQAPDFTARVRRLRPGNACHRGRIKIVGQQRLQTIAARVGHRAAEQLSRARLSGLYREVAPISCPFSGPENRAARL